MCVGRVCGGWWAEAEQIECCVPPEAGGGGRTRIPMPDANEPQTGRTQDAPEPLEWAEFLSITPPGKTHQVGSAVSRNAYLLDAYTLLTPELRLHCTGKQCKGARIFACSDSPGDIYPERAADVFIEYRCRNCNEESKTYAVLLLLAKDAAQLTAYKYGEWPPYGPHVPSRLIGLIGPDKGAFLLGRRSESQSMGIGAFAYYRRVVENQRGRLLDEIVKVAKQLDAPRKSLETLMSARGERQFGRAVEIMRPAFPEVLLIKGHNPFSLLHGALSEGLHAKTDQQCLELATSIRTILTELAERIGLVLREKRELNTAVTRLFRKDGDAPGKGTPGKLD